MAHALRIPKLLKAFSKLLLKAKGKEWVPLVLADFSVSDPLFLR